MAFCSNCGVNLEEGVKFCSDCGNAIGKGKRSPVQNQEPSPAIVETVQPSGHRKLRHGFTSFWLWLGLIGYGLMVLLFAIDLFFLDNEIFEEFSGKGFRGGIPFLIGLVAFYKLINWERWGVLALLYIRRCFLYIYSI